MKYRRGELIPIDLNKPSEDILNRLMDKFTNMLIFIQKIVDKEIMAGGRDKVKKEKLDYLVRRIAKTSSPILAKSAVSCFKQYFNESYEVGQDVVTLGNYFILTTGFSLSADTNAVEINGEGSIYCSITHELPFDSTVSQVRFERREDEWFVIFYTAEFELKEILKDKTNLEEWARASYPDDATLKEGRFYHPEKAKFDKRVFNITPSRENEELVKRHAIVYTACYNILLDVIISNFNLSDLKFIRETTVTKYFTQLKNEGYIKLFDTSDGVIRSVCREVAATVMFIIRYKPKDISFRDPFKATSFFYVFDRATFINGFRTIYFPKGVSFNLETTVPSEATTDIVAIRFKKEDNWKVILFRMTEEERERRIRLRNKWRDYYKEKRRNQTTQPS